MTKKGWYIGTPNGIVLCVENFDRETGVFAGKFYQRYRAEATEFTGTDMLLQEMEQFFDDINFPHPTTTLRSFGEEAHSAFRRQGKEEMMKDEELLKKHGDLGTFIIRVQHRQNSSWQGRLTWMEEDKTVYFRSIWEMIKLVESALDSVGAEKEETEVRWTEE